MEVFALVFSSTFFTITAQYKDKSPLLLFSVFNEPGTTTE